MKGYRNGSKKQSQRKVSQVAAELKSVDNAIACAADTTGLVQLMNGMVQGTDFDERVGRQIHCERLEMDLLHYVTPATGADQVTRVMIVKDKQANGVAPAIGDILTSIGVFAPLNLNNRHRFNVLYDKRHLLNASAEPGSYAMTSVVVPVRCLTTYNAGVAGTIADINTNSIYFVSIGNLVAGNTASVVNGTIRLRFTDV